MPKYQIMANSTHFLVKIHPTQVMKSAFVIVSGVGRKKMGRNFSESCRVLHCRQLNRPVMTDRYSESLPKHGGDAFNHSAWGISMLYIY